MITHQHILALTILILVTLLLRDLPYFNVIVINKIWILYLIMLLLVALSSIRFKFSIVSYVTLLLFVAAFILTLLGLTFFAEGIGTLIYFALWILLIYNIISFMKKSH